MTARDNSCGGCAFVSESPVRLLTGRIVCQTCPRASEERAARERHVWNLQRCHTKQDRNDYMARLEATEGVASAEAVRTAFDIWWDQRKAEQER